MIDAFDGVDRLGGGLQRGQSHRRVGKDSGSGHFEAAVGLSTVNYAGGDDDPAVDAFSNESAIAQCFELTAVINDEAVLR
ncbi:hypothetical protein [Mycobacterium colombiense]|uniref:hypothetical protein n=1 Tax=Mycobacterium colombiense TaxID=339268 RepID=UPI0010577071|nr:hypothetical protein [Mycobacterium colombiense]